MGQENVVIHIHNDVSEEVFQKIFHSLNQFKKEIMATLQEISDKCDALQAALDSEQQQISDAIAALQQTVSDLTTQLADGGTAEQRQAVLDKLNATIADLQSTIPDAPPAPAA